MPIKVSSILDGTSTAQKTKGFVAALLLVVSLLTSIEFLGAIEFRNFPREYWTSTDPSKPAFGFPNYQNPDYQLTIISIGEYAGSIDIIASKVDGWEFNGTFYLGDTILLGNHRITLKEINMDKAKPIQLEYYTLIDLKFALIALLVVLAIVAYYVWRK